MILDLVFDLQINFNETTYRYRKANSVIHKNTLVKIIAVTSISWRVHITHFLKLTLHGLLFPMLPEALFLADTASERWHESRFQAN